MKRASDIETDRPSKHTVAGDLLALLDEPSTSDVTVVIQERNFPAHRAVLLARCDFFRAMFASGFSDGSTREVSLKDVDPDAFALLLQYMYGGVLELCAPELLKPAIQLADQLLLADASAELQGRLLDSVDETTIVSNMLWAEQRGYSDMLAKLEDAYVHEYGPSVDEEGVMRMADHNPRLLARLHIAIHKARSCPTRGGRAASKRHGASSKRNRPRHGLKIYPTLESMTADAKAAVVAEIDALLEESGRDELVELEDLRRRLAAGDISIASAALEAYLQWMSANHDVELAKGNMLPDIVYDEDSKMFSFM